MGMYVEWEKEKQTDRHSSVQVAFLTFALRMSLKIKKYEILRDIRSTTCTNNVVQIKMRFADLSTDLQTKQVTNKANKFKHVKPNSPKLSAVSFVRRVHRFTQRINSICTDTTDPITGRKQKIGVNPTLSDYDYK